jgi:adenosine deaminase
VDAARDAGLGVTIHVGEEGGRFGLEEIAEVVGSLRPDRIGHGILAAREPELMALVAEAGITLEVCPTSNLLTKALPDERALRETFRAFLAHGVPFTIATDGPEMMRTHLRDEFEFLLRIGALDADEAHAANERGHRASFLAASAPAPAA